MVLLSLSLDLDFGLTLGGWVLSSGKGERKGMQGSDKRAELSR